MNQQEILKKIGGIIAELRDQYSYLEASSESLNELELELFMANANFLTDHIEILKKIQNQLASANLPAALPSLSAEKVYGQKQEIPDYFSEEEHLEYEEEKFPAKIEATNFTVEIAETKLPAPEEVKMETIILPEVMPQDEAIELPESNNASFTGQKLVTDEVIDLPPVADVSFIAQKPAPVEKAFEEVIAPEVEVIPEVKTPTVINIQPKVEPEPVAFVEEKTSEPIKPEPIKQEFREPEPAKPATVIPEPVRSELAKSEGEHVLTLNERIAAQRNLDQTKAVAPEITNKAPLQTANTSVPDLQSLISLNDKLLFVKDLFNGYNLAYTEAINILNRYTTFEQAENFLNINYTGKNNWKDKPATSERFFDILRRKFS